jgi:hypothetical protein
MVSDTPNDSIIAYILLLKPVLAIWRRIVADL